MLNAIVKWSVFFYGILLIILGIVGYKVAGSIPSIVIGSGFGFLLMICSLLMFLKKRAGLICSTAITLLLTAFFAYRYSTTRGLMPALLAVLGGAMLVFLLLHCARWKRNS